MDDIREQSRKNCQSPSYKSANDKKLPNVPLDHRMQRLTRNPSPSDNHGESRKSSARNQTGNVTNKAQSISSRHHIEAMPDYLIQTTQLQIC
ncbi:hypothetical protein NPIL_505941 [Nephila pilipes]|uniref:Uncharacterized protein n=1 Tax=Nephila pilipes TaxID=299642 RepID=A0A8X6NBG8_NEPPI|nr:hypothetical protein NPIL_505941 [Nephila pilipes]